MSSTLPSFINQWKNYAMELQIKHGVPASLTLAQAFLESSRGTSHQASANNNYFGLRLHGQYVHFGNAKDSFYYYARTVSGGTAFRRNTAGIASTDVNSYLNAVCRSGYAEDRYYHGKIVNIINKYDLTQFDRQAVREAQGRGVKVGYLRGSKKGDDYHPYSEIDDSQMTATSMVESDDFNRYAESKNIGTEKVDYPLEFIPGQKWSMPVPSDKWEVIGKFGTHRKGDSQVHAHNHGGIDIRTRDRGPAGKVSVLATEDNGKVIDAHKSATGGNMVKIQYNRPNGDVYVCTYMHLTSYKVHAGQEVHAGQDIGVTGSTGHAEGPHLHFEVTRNGKRIDPVMYCTEMGIRGGFDPKLIDDKTGRDLTKNYENKMVYTGSQQQTGTAAAQADPASLGALAQMTQSGDPNDWMNALMQQNGDLFEGDDLLGCVVSAVFGTMRQMAFQLAQADFQEQLEKAADDADKTPSEGVDNNIPKDKAEEKANELSHAASAEYDSTVQKQEEETRTRQLA